MIRRRKLGRTGFEVSELGFGSWPIGGKTAKFHYGDVKQTEIESVLLRYFEDGGNFLDTARAYGESERILGGVLSRYDGGDKIILATKTEAGETIDSVPQIRKDLEESLRLLRRDYVDLYYLHQPPETRDAMNRALDEMEQLKRENKIRAIGASIKGPNVNNDTERLCLQYLNTGRLDVLQLVYSILRQRLRGVMEEARRRKVGIVIRTALESGLLTGSYTPGHTFAGRDQRTRYKKENLDFILNAAQEISRFAVYSPFRTLGQVALRFSMEPVEVSSVIVGMCTTEELKQNEETASLPGIQKDLIERLKREYFTLNDKANYY